VWSENLEEERFEGIIRGRKSKKDRRHIFAVFIYILNYQFIRIQMILILANVKQDMSLASPLLGRNYLKRVSKKILSHPH
jgi:hypothetical protein